MNHGTTNKAATEAAPDRCLEDPGTVVEAERLFKGGQVLVIEFRGERYRLRKTRNGKLILTK
ncbi:MAG: hemin uptake protein HemP [Thiobacillus sp.]|nr:hemin uptake protein HemP [Thiobacillus sp.]